jgi:hypothetical protein
MQMNDEHRRIAEEIYKISAFALTETGKEIPVFILVKHDMPIPLLVPPDKDMDMGAYIMSALSFAKQYDADALILVASMWVVSGKLGEIDTRIKPSESPDREEYLNLIYMTADGLIIESLSGKVETTPIGTKFIRSQEWMDSTMKADWLQPWRV